MKKDGPTTGCTTGLPYLAAFELGRRERRDLRHLLGEHLRQVSARRAPRRGLCTPATSVNGVSPTNRRPPAGSPGPRGSDRPIQPGIRSSEQPPDALTQHAQSTEIAQQPAQAALQDDVHVTRTARRAAQDNRQAPGCRRESARRCDHRPGERCTRRPRCWRLRAFLLNRRRAAVLGNASISVPRRGCGQRSCHERQGSREPEPSKCVGTAERAGSFPAGPGADRRAAHLWGLVMASRAAGQARLARSRSAHCAGRADIRRHAVPAM